MPSSSTSPASHTQVEIMELRAQEAEAALEAIRAKRMLAEARSTQASTRQHSRTPSVAAPEVEHFDIADPEERETNSNNNANNMHDPVIEHGEVTLPLAATHEPSASSRVDQLREFWSSFQRSDSTPRAMIAPALTPPPAHQVDDARDRKIDELRRQLQDLEQRTRPTRTSPDTANQAKNIDFAQPHYIHQPKISEVPPPPGLKSEYGTPQGSDRGEWEVNTSGLDENEINLRILKKIDRAEHRQKHGEHLHSR